MTRYSTYNHPEMLGRKLFGYEYSRQLFPGRITMPPKRKVKYVRGVYVPHWDMAPWDGKERVQWRKDRKKVDPFYIIPRQ